MADNVPIIPIAALVDENSPDVELLRSADLITAVDVATKKEGLVYGLDILDAISESKQPLGVKLVKVSISQDADIDKLLAIVKTVKGSEDYSRMRERRKP
jgi:hypothetical protein